MDNSSESTHSATEGKEEGRTDAQPAEEHKKPDYRSYVPKGQSALPQLKVGNEVRFRLSSTESPLWTVDKIVINETTKEKEFRLKKSDGSLHPDPVQRDKLTLKNEKK